MQTAPKNTRPPNIKMYRRLCTGPVRAWELGALGYWPAEVEKHLKREADRKLLVAELPYGGGQVSRTVDRLNALAQRSDWDLAQKIQTAVQAWRRVKGWYYTHKRSYRKGGKTEDEYLQGVHDAADKLRDWERKWFAELQLKGKVERVANFRIECLYLLNKVNGDVDRLVRLVNAAGERTGIVALDAEAFHAPQKFRKWCLNHGNFIWNAGEKELQMLHSDVAASTAWRSVQEIAACGWHEVKDSPSKGLWFFDDCAYAAGKPIKADEHGIFWFEEKGYLLSDRGREARFFQARPRMYPDSAVADLLPRYPGTDAERLRAFWVEVTTRLCQNTGSRAGHLLMGAMLAYAAAPEIYAQFGCFPGLWVHGVASSGKTMALEWLMHVWGFNISKGLDLARNVTPVGMLMASEQYSNLPLWFDEYRQDAVVDEKVAILRSCYNRGSQAKWTPDGLQREIRTSFVVTGESTSSDGATRSRYPHVQVAETRRKESLAAVGLTQAEMASWFKANQDSFIVLARAALERREEFAALTLRMLQSYRESPQLEPVAERDKLVHGVAYAAWVAMDCLLEGYGLDEQQKFKTFMLEHSLSASADVASELNTNRFWEDLLAAFHSEELPLDAFRVQTTALDHAPDAPEQPNWVNYKLFIYPELVLSAMQIWMKKRGEVMPLKRKDLRDQLGKNAYWMGSKIRLRWGGVSVAVWGVDLDLHPMGYHPVAQEEYEAFHMDRSIGDPRLGPLYAICQAVEREQRRRKSE